MKKPKRNINLTRAPHAVVPDLQPARGDVVAGHQPHPGLRVLAPRRGLVAPVRAVRHGVAQRGHAPALPAAAPPLVLDSLNHMIDIIRTKKRIENLNSYYIKTQSIIDSLEPMDIFLHP